ncbi:type I polyketide synthase [Parafrankia discariae]|uniref:type I polyketide synthase n=1 Tax=Parafrankia discariae TaxID=365528 RepID=UPI00037C981D|nr:type I polyketide synthase [Parafrankia discariae]
MDSTRPEQGHSGETADQARDAWRARLVELSPAAQIEALLDLVVDHVVVVTGGRGGSAGVDRGAPWRALGVYRRIADVLRAKLTAATGVRLPATVLFERPTPKAVASFLHAEILGVREETAGPAPAPAAPAAGGGRGADPVVVVGLGCRLPGADSPAALWELVAQGRDVVAGLPTDRGWDLDGIYHPDPEHPGTAYTRQGGFLPGVGLFDAGFFGIGPREATAMDPQQRLMLEVSWEAFEHAGIDPHQLRGSRTGVFTGVSLQDYGPPWHDAPAELQGHLLTGNALGVIAGRVSYTFGFEGPALTVDTQCSASLVAVHLAAQALYSGECDLALAGGVTVMSTPSMLMEFSRKRGLAPDGRCKAFSADADGTGWAEGATVVVLTRLSHARARQLPVLAVVAGSAVNQDGASNGLTAPNGLSQQRLIQQALANAGLRAGDVDAVEAHGTGTPLGDPIEARALLATYGAGRSPDRPLYLGSLKSNIGHAQAAAGTAGVIKMIEALRHETLPASLHITAPTPHVDWSTGAVTLLTRSTPWPATTRPRRAAVSAFGVSGTNAHLILEEPPGPARIPAQATPADADGAGAGATEDGAGATGDSATAGGDTPGWAASLPTTVILSARGDDALRAHAARLADHLTGHPDITVDDAAHTLGTRARFATRAAVVLDGPPAERASHLVRALSTLATGRAAPALLRGSAPADPAGTRIAMVFTGQGSQLHGMGRRLHTAYPAFARALDTACDHLDPHLDEPLRDVMFAAPDTAPAVLLDQTLYTQCALFAYQSALFRLLESFGVTPHLLLGHSVGEFTAAHVAGVWTLPDATALVAARGRLMQSCAPGAMAAVGATEDEVRRCLPEYAGLVDIAAVNGPTAVVVAGDPDAVGALAARWAEQGRPTRRLAVSHAFHSAHMDPVLDRFAAVARTLAYHPPTVPIASALTGRLSTDPDTPVDLTDPGYWVRHIREPVRFHQATVRARAENITTYLEIGPKPTLTPYLGEGRVVTAARRGQPETTALHIGLAELHTHGTPIAWPAANNPHATSRRPAHRHLPTYPFQRRRHWTDPVRRSTPSAPDGTLTPGGTAGPDGWRYRINWHSRPVPHTGALPGTDGTPPPLVGRWLLLLPPTGVTGEEVSRVSWIVERLGGTVLRVPLRHEDTDRARLAARLRALGRPGATAGRGGVLSLLGLDTTRHPDHPGLTTGFALTCVLAQALHDVELDAPLWALTRGAVQTGAGTEAEAEAGGGDGVRDPAGALLWGLGRSLALERPGHWGGLVDLPAELDDSTLGWLGAALTAPDGEDQFAARPAGLLVPRLVQEAAPVTTAPWDVRGAVVLITGGTGALGTRIARRLAHDGARRLILASRRGPDAPGAAELCAELTALGTQTVVRHCDAAAGGGGTGTGTGQLAALVRELAADPEAPLSVIVHAAGVDGPLAALPELDLDQIAAVLAPKAGAAELLHEAAWDIPLVFLSSVSATWGSGGQAPYSAANAYLDALAAFRHAAGRPAVSVAFGPWAEAGMGAEPARRDYLRRRGLNPLPPDRAVDALARAVGAGHPGPVTVADVDWTRFLAAYTAARPSRLFDELPAAADHAGSPAAVDTPGAGTGRPPADAGTRPADLTGPPPGDLADPGGDLAALPAAERGRALRDLVQAEAAAVLGHREADEVETGRRFLELGFDSLASVQLSRRLAGATGVALATAAVFEHPTVADLADHLHSLLASRPATGTAGTAGTAGGVTRPGTRRTSTGPRAGSGSGGGGDHGGAEQTGVRGLYRQACADGKFAEGVGVLRAAARLRATFTTSSELTRRPRPVTLASGPATPALVCLPSMVAPSGPHTFARLALHLHGRRAVHALAHPGFGDGELLPATADLVVDLHAETVAARFPDTPVALAGYSSGGWLAHAVAARLEARGIRPSAVVLLDTWLPGDRIPEADIAEELRGIAVNDQAFALMTESQVTAQGAYLDLFEGWKPTAVRAPIVLVRALQRMPGQRTDPGAAGPSTGWADEWDLAFDTVDTSGDHQSMMNEHAGATARTIHAWLDGLGSRRPPLHPVVSGTAVR